MCMSDLGFDVTPGLGLFLLKDHYPNRSSNREPKLSSALQASPGGFGLRG